MSIRWHDVSIPIHEQTTVWPGDDPVRIKAASRIADGDSCNTSTLTLPSHTGTHCDAPWHFEDEGKRLHEVDFQRFFGEATVMALPGRAQIYADDLGPSPLPKRLLLKTDNAKHPVNGPFNTGLVAVGPDAAQRMVDEGVELVGIDYLSIAPYKDSGPTHHILLENEVFVVEGLVLAGVEAGVYPFTVLPMPLHGLDGAPCRAFIGLPE
ncbi:MAG: cyclase family protein [Candidatus Hydrogenedentes bacterium]|nr:cyclase family protein [Candidatus Hydrogenedentota bacterium]